MELSGMDWSKSDSQSWSQTTSPSNSSAPSPVASRWGAAINAATLAGFRPPLKVLPFANNPFFDSIPARPPDSDAEMLETFSKLKSKDMDEILSKLDMKCGGTKEKKKEKYKRYLHLKKIGGGDSIGSDNRKRGKNFTIGETCRLIHIVCDPSMRIV